MLRINEASSSSWTPTMGLRSARNTLAATGTTRGSTLASHRPEAVASAVSISSVVDPPMSCASRNTPASLRRVHRSS
jgi:hypothetical protein